MKTYLFAFVILVANLALADHRDDDRPGRHPHSYRDSDHERYRGHRNHRNDHWQKNRERYREIVESLVLNEGRLIGYTQLSDETFDYDNVDVINKENVDAIKLKVTGDDAFIGTLSVRFCDGLGETQTIIVDQKISVGWSTGWFDLRGKNRCIDSFAVTGRGDRGLDESIVVLVGKNLPENDFGYNKRHRPRR